MVGLDEIISYLITLHADAFFSHIADQLLFAVLIERDLVRRFPAVNAQVFSSGINQGGFQLTARNFLLNHGSVEGRSRGDVCVCGETAQKRAQNQEDADLACHCQPRSVFSSANGLDAIRLDVYQGGVSKRLKWEVSHERSERIRKVFGKRLIYWGESREVREWRLDPERKFLIIPPRRSRFEPL
jgi:hypothetical protein